MKRTLCAGIFISLLLVFDQELGDAPYGVLLATVLALGVVALLQNLEGMRSRVTFEPSRARLGGGDCAVSYIILWLWIPIIASWFIGALTGLSNGAPGAYVLRNFFGLLSFALLPLLVLVGVSAPMLIRTVLAAALVQGAIGIVVTIVSPPDLTLLLDAGSISDLRTLYSVGFISIFPLLTTGLAVRWLCSPGTPELRSRLVRFTGTRTAILFALLTLIVPAMSKGFILATGLLLAAMLAFSTLYALRFRMSWWPTIGALAVCAAIVISLPSEVFSLLGYSFTAEEAGNSLRAEQYGYLMSEMSWFGSGLGTALRSGYSRGDVPYGFELTYLNIAQKLGIWSLFLFLAYFLSIALALRRLWRRRYVVESAFCLGAMGYLVVGAANPLLLSPTAAVLQCLVIYLLAKPYLSYRYSRVKPIEQLEAGREC